MKLTLLICLVLVLATVSAARNRVAKKSYVQMPSETPEAPQWTCKRVDTVNLRAKEARANGTKCSYLQFIKMKIVEQYTVPQYPSCYAQLDAKCDANIVDWKEKRTVRKFSFDLQMSCTGAGEVPAQWEDVQTQLDEWREKFGETMNTPYWNCVEETIAPWIAEQFVTFTPFPAPFLDVMNYVCQGVVSKVKNVDRIAFNDWMEANENFVTVKLLGTDLFDEIQDQFNQADLHEEITQCYSAEAGYFSRSVYAELDGAQNEKERQGTGFSQAYIRFDERLQQQYDGEDGEIFGDQWNQFDGEEEGFQSWIYYAPKKHYHETETNVNEDTFSGNKGHPLCPSNEMLYLPLTMYGPICCSIEEPTEKPFTYNCASNSIHQSQGGEQKVCKKVTKKSSKRYGQCIKRRGRIVWSKETEFKLISSDKECGRCQCLKGYKMVYGADYWNIGEDLGACVRQNYEQDDGEE